MESTVGALIEAVPRQHDTINIISRRAWFQLQTRAAHSARGPSFQINKNDASQNFTIIAFLRCMRITSSLSINIIYRAGFTNAANWRFLCEHVISSKGVSL